MCVSCVPFSYYYVNDCSGSRNYKEGEMFKIYDYYSTDWNYFSNWYYYHYYLCENKPFFLFRSHERVRIVFQTVELQQGSYRYANSTILNGVGKLLALSISSTRCQNLALRFLVRVTSKLMTWSAIHAGSNFCFLTWILRICIRKWVNETVTSSDGWFSQKILSLATKLCTHFYYYETVLVSISFFFSDDNHVQQR